MYDNGVDEKDIQYNMGHKKSPPQGIMIVGKRKD